MAKKKRKKKKVNNKVIVLIAVILALATIIYGLKYLDQETNFFNIADVSVTGCTVYPEDYLVKKSNIVLGEKIYDVKSEKIEEILEEQEYIRDCNLVYVIPNRIKLEIIERQEKYLINYNNNQIITDENGVVLSANIHNNKLFIIDLYSEIEYNIGKKLYISEYDDFIGLNNLLDYSDTFSEIDRINSIELYSNDVIVIKTNYNMNIKMSLLDDVKYNYYYAIKIVKTRLGNGEEVAGCLVDFTKGENPVFSYGD